MSSIGFEDAPDWEAMREDAERELAFQDEIERPLREAGLPVPDPTRRRREIAPERLDVVALWRGLSDEEREAIGVLGLGLLVSGGMASRAELTAPAATRAYTAHYHACLDALGTLPTPESAMAALRGPAWRIPADLGPVCLSCGCSEADACPGGCGWEDERQIRCTVCASPPPLDDDSIPF
ncbi:hypothetical protein [Methylobacterium indicum]|uniref:Uncharacterized protein n=1 Tax=Methylobacterium indicum TaxID=1775910 RepID=A0A8H9C6Y5_9HYPH|nr:hypothetical protein [Methylobacterium indicum]BCM83810.1 hypothetical protein mvi_22710 [Methylobacterium indicum]